MWRKIILPPAKKIYKELNRHKSIPRLISYISKAATEYCMQNYNKEELLNNIYKVFLMNGAIYSQNILLGKIKKRLFK